MPRPKITVWLDRVNEPDDPSWIVDTDDAGVSNTLAAFPGTDAGHMAAVRRADEEAATRGLEFIGAQPGRPVRFGPRNSEVMVWAESESI